MNSDGKPFGLVTIEFVESRINQLDLLPVFSLTPVARDF